MLTQNWKMRILGTLAAAAGAAGTLAMGGNWKAAGTAFLGSLLTGLAALFHSTPGTPPPQQ